MADWLEPVLEQMLGERELAFMKQAPGAVERIALVIFLLSGLIWGVGFKMLYEQRVRLKSQVAEM